MRSVYHFFRLLTTIFCQNSRKAAKPHRFRRFNSLFASQKIGGQMKKCLSPVSCVHFYCTLMCMGLTLSYKIRLLRLLASYLSTRDSLFLRNFLRQNDVLLEHISQRCDALPVLREVFPCGVLAVTALHMESPSNTDRFPALFVCKTSAADLRRVLPAHGRLFALFRTHRTHPFPVDILFVMFPFLRL